ncbi:MAG: type II secretion system protein GspM [Steroidobacteraceae bacterium]
MNAPAITALTARFDRLSLRERVLTGTATLVVLIAVFNVLVFEPLEKRRTRLAQQLTQIAASIADTAAAGNGSDATGATLQRTMTLAAQLSQVTARLNSRSAGLIPPQRMTQVIHDVLSRQQEVTLISLRSLAPYSLIDGPDGKGAAPQPSASDSATPQTLPAAAFTSTSDGPYVHSVEMVLQGPYLDVLTYLQALEGLQWHFYWQSLALDATRYPMTRVTVRLGTVSMSRDWIDL